MGSVLSGLGKYFREMWGKFPLSTRERALRAVRKDGHALLRVSEELKNDPDVVLAAVRENGYVLQYASQALRNDPAIVLAAVRQTWQAFHYASQSLRNDHDMAMKVVQQNGYALSGLPEALKNDPVIVKAAVQQNGHVLRDVSDSLKNNHDIVLAAVRQNALALRYASYALTNNREIVLAAVRQNWRAAKFASEGMKYNPDIRQIVQEEEQKKSSGGGTQALNFLWINLDLPPPPDPADGSIRMPLPEEYIDNVRMAGKRHPRADIHLWVDSRRITQKQWDYLEAILEDGMSNVHLKDLCSIPEYRDEELYSRPETKKKWRDGYRGVVWLQVDAAKILVSLQGDYDQKFFADLDHAHLDIGSAQVQKMLGENGLMIGSADVCSFSIENQLWGFDRSRENFFREYYAEGLKMSYQGQIAYSSLSPKVHTELYEREQLSDRDIILPIGSIGLAHAVQPGHKWNGNSGYKGRSVVASHELETIFNERGRRGARSSAKAAPDANPAVPVI